jgi:serine/threonine protein kinase
MVDRTGEQIGNYRLVKLLGSGGFADVYLGQQIYLDSAAAIKLLHTHLAQEDLEGFRAEARTLVRLIHPHIIRLLDFGLDGNTPFLVMDYAPNGTIRQRHARGQQLPLATVIDYTHQVASALQYAHDQKVIHRDVKPENMLLGRENEILLTDFGIAVVAQSTRTEMTQETVGTISYMAPEQIQSHPRPASDQYSLGVVVYEWLSGQRPFTGTFTELAVKHMMVPPPPLHDVVPNIPPEVEQVVMTALAKDPKQRFGSVQAFATALERAGHLAKAINEQDTILPQPSPIQQPAQASKESQGFQGQVALSSPPPSHTPIPPAPLTPVPPSQPTEVADPARNPVSAGWNQPTEFATALNTPDLPVGKLPAINYDKKDVHATELMATPSQPQLQPAQGVNQQISGAIRSSVREEQATGSSTSRGMSRRAFLFGGTAVGILVAGGAVVAVLTHSNSGTPNTSNTTQTTRTPAATHTTTTGTGATTLGQDNFHRGNQQFWGTSSGGQAWSGDVATSIDCSISGQTGQIQRAGNGHSLYSAILGPVVADAEILVSGMMSHYSDQTHSSHFAAMLRFSNNRYYKAYIDGTKLSFLKRLSPAQGPTFASIGFPAQAGTSYTLRFRVVGNTLSARVWQTGTTEPTQWTLTATDNDIAAAGNGGLRPQIDQGVTLNVTSFQLTTAK